MFKDTGKSIKPIRVDQQLDLYGLDPYEFRVYGHIAHRGNCYSNLKTMAAICNMSVRQVQYALKKLKEKNLISQEKRPGTTDRYQITNTGSWKEPNYSEPLQKGMEYFNRGLIRRELNDIEGALQDFKKSVELFRQELSKTKGNSTRKQKDLYDAEQELKKTEEKVIELRQLAEIMRG